MKLRRTHAAPVGHPYRDRELHRPAGAPPVAAHVRDQLVEARVAERVVLHLADGAEPGHAQADRAAQDAGLGERRVDAAIGPEAVEQTGGGAEDAARAAHVLAHHHDRVVARELDVQAVVDRLDDEEISQLRLRGCAAARQIRRRTTRADSRARCRTRGRDVGIGLRFGRGDACAHRVGRLRLDLGLELVAEDAEAAEIALVPAEALVLLLLLDALEIDVRARIVGGRVRRGAIRHRLDERRPFPCTRALDGFARRLVHRQHVPAVDPRARHAVADRLVRERLGARLRRQRRRDRPLVVVAEEDERRLHHRCQVRALVERALGGGAVAEVDDRAAALALQLLPPGESCGMRHVRRDRHADRRDVVLRRVPPAGGMAAPPVQHGS